jgi:cytochrome P450
MTFILAMLTNPDVQHRAQSEIDSVLEPDRLPTFSDLNGLPYFSAIIKEVLRYVPFFFHLTKIYNAIGCIRWNPIAPLGVPHANIDEDVYEGYYIPKDCLVISNI